MNHLGKVKPGSTVYMYFDSFDGGTGASITMSGLAVGDIQIYKDGGMTQRASTAGFTLLDTDGIDIDATTGIHGISIDLADNTTANFYEAGSHYVVVIASITVDAQTVNFVLGDFTIGYEGAILDTTIASLSLQTSFTLEDGSADNSAYVGCPVIVHDLASGIQVAFGVISAYTGASKTVTLAADPGIFTMAAGDHISLFPPANTRWAGTTLWGSGAITAASIASNAIAAAKIASGAITSAKFAASAIDATAIASNAITAAKIATDAITADKIAADAIGSSELATTAVNEIRDAILSDSTAFAGANIAAIVADTNELQTDWVDGGRLDLILDARASQTTADAIETDTQDIQSRIPAVAPIEGTADSGTTTTMVDAARTEADTDYWAGSWILFTSGTINGQARLITAFTPASDTITFSPATTQAVGTNTYRILPAAHIEEVSTLTGHTAQTGDNFARLGAPAGASVSADILAIDNFVDDLETRLGTPSDLGGGATVAANLSDMAGATFSTTTDSQEAIRDRGDAAWTTGGGGSITDILNIQPLIPESIDLANTATWRLGLMLYNALDDLPSTGEIDPGTISIERKAIGGTSWSAVVTDAACSEAAGLVYYDEVFDSGTGYAEGDSLRVTFKSQKITVSANDYEISDATGRFFYTEIRQTERGTDSAMLATEDGSSFTAIPWNTNWDTEVQSEVDDALVAQGLDHLVNAAVVGADVTDNSIAAKLVSASATADWDDFVNTTDSLQAVRDHIGDGTNLTEAGGTGDQLTALATAASISALNDISTAQVNTEVDTALTDIGLDHLLAAAVVGADVTDNSIIAKLVDDAATADWDNYDNTTASLEALNVDTDAIVADTNELQGDWVNGGRLDLLLDQVITDIAALNDVSTADINAQVLDVLNTDTFAEPTGVPGATVTLATKIGYLYMALRNQVTITATKKTFFDDGGSAEWEKDLSDDGTTYTETEGNAI